MKLLLTRKNIINELVNARRKKALTQEYVAEKMQTAPSAVARLESLGGKKNHSPSLRTINKYADAVEVEIEFIVTNKDESYGK